MEQDGLGECGIRLYGSKYADCVLDWNWAGWQGGEEQEVRCFQTEPRKGHWCLTVMYDLCMALWSVLFWPLGFLLATGSLPILELKNDEP